MIKTLKNISKIVLPLSLFILPLKSVADSPYFGAGGGAAASQAAVGNYVIEATSFGVAANGITLTDISSTSGSAAITSASYTFTQADVGKDFIGFVGTSNTTTGNTTNNFNQISSLASVSGIAVYDEVIGTGVKAGAYVVAIDNVNLKVYTSVGGASTNTGTTLTFVHPVISTITSVSGGVATIGTNAGTTTSGTRALFGTDDSVAYNNAILAASLIASTLPYVDSATQGVTIQMPSGMSMISTMLTGTGLSGFPANVSMQGINRNTSILEWASPNTMTMANGAMIYNQGGAYYSTNHDNVFSNFWIDMQAAIDTGPYDYNGSCIRFTQNADITITNMKFTGSPATCIGTDYPQRAIITNNIFEGDARLGLQGGGAFAVLMGENGNQGIPENFIFTGNQVRNTGSWAAMAENANLSINGNTYPTRYQDTGVIADNVIWYDAYQINNTRTMAIADAGLYGVEIHDNVIAGPPVNDNTKVGIGLNCGDNTSCGTPTTPQTARHGNIHDNYVYGMGIGYSVQSPMVDHYTFFHNTAEASGSTTQGCFAVTVTTTGATGLTFDDNFAYKCAGAGYSIGTSLTNLTLKNNRSVDAGTGGSVTSGFNFASTYTTTGLIMDGNIAYDDGNHTQNHAVNFAGTVTGATITNNKFANNYTTNLVVSGTVTGLWQNNTGMPAATLSGCSATTPIGSGDIGGYTSGTTGSCATTITPYGTTNIIAPTGWQCTAFDSTTPADIQTQTASTTTSATVTGVTVSGDAVKYQCRMW